MRRQNTFRRARLGVLRNGLTRIVVDETRLKAVTPFSRTVVWGLGDTTRRLVRGFANATLVPALGIVGVNIHLIQKFLHRVVFDLNTNPSDPVTTQPRKRVSNWNTFGNAVPQAPPGCSLEISKVHRPYGPCSTGRGLLPN